MIHYNEDGDLIIEDMTLEERYNEALQMIMIDYAAVLEKAGVYHEISTKLQELGV